MSSTPSRAAPAAGPGTAPSTAPTTALVWFKRDLRVRDHAPLAAAQHFQHALALVVIEPAWLASPECSPQHVAWMLQCVQALRTELAARGLPLLVLQGDVPDVLQRLQQQVGITHIFSHEETGPGWSYSRDIAVAKWCKNSGVLWREWPQTGVVRRLRTRQGWAGRWLHRMNAPEAALAGIFNGGSDPCLQAHLGSCSEDIQTSAQALPTLRSLGLAQPTQPLPPAGEMAAWATLHSFLGGRGRGYRSALSSPLSAESGCSRISAHLAFGTISTRCVHQATDVAIAAAAPRGDAELAYGLRGFASRLRWHCHFMQKLEDEPAIEWRNFARSADGLRAGDGVHPGEPNTELLQAWCEGRTGYPMVDACMRQLRATGWLNFRMRAMLVSFAAYHLGQHWRAPGLHLARLFLDFEPGIHWSQMQMQSGTTGINTLRMYSPAKQARDHDPQGVYQRRWLPEWGSAAYPAPVVDEGLALAAAKEQFYGLRKTLPAQAEAQDIQQRHGSRKSGLPPTGRAGVTRQRADAVRKPSPASADAGDDAAPQQGELF